MNSNTSVESHTILREQPLRPSNSQAENLLPVVSQLEHTMRPQIQLPISPIGESESQTTSNHSETHSLPQRETSSANPLPSLKSNAKPHEIQEKLPVEPRVLRVSKADIAVFCQVLTEFHEQFGSF